MKELSIEQKAKRYDEAIERAKNFIENGDERERTIAESIFAGLMEESEDEKIRNEIIAFVEQAIHRGGGTPIPQEQEDRWISWLEKLEIKEHDVCDFCDEKASCVNPCPVKLVEQKPNPCENCSIASNNCRKFPCAIRDGEQKPADKVEPKFKVGDEIKTKNEESLIITRIDRWGYWSEDLFICNFDDADKWELVEQKPADKVEPKFKVGDKIKLAKEPKYPAREIIAIKNDAYYFDELVHLPLRWQDNWELVEQNPAWSEEDKMIFC